MSKPGRKSKLKSMELISAKDFKICPLHNKWALAAARFKKQTLGQFVEDLIIAGILTSAKELEYLLGEKQWVDYVQETCQEFTKQEPLPIGLYENQG